MDEETSEWVFDFMMNLFQSPSWEVPIMCFIDENCASFDTGEENKFIYSDLHEQFRELVESILCSNLADLGLTGSDFADICQNQINKRGINKEVVTQILAMDDFLTFKKLMTKRNLELELEVLEAMQQEGGLQQRSEPSSIEEDLMQLSILHKQEEMEQAELEAAIAMSMALQKEQKRIVCVASKIAEDKNSSSSNQQAAEDLLQQLQASQNKAQETLKKNKDLLTEKKNDLQQATAEFSDDEIKQREKYLREQRDRIVAKKKKEREEQLKEFHKEQKQTTPDPPAQVAEKIREISQEEVKKAQDEEKRNALRLALARRMKQDLLSNEQDEPSAVKELDAQIGRVEKLRRDNQTKESKMIRRKS